MEIFQDKVDFIENNVLLDFSDINKLYKSYNFDWYRIYFIKINGIIYFYKKNLSNRKLLNELLGQSFSKYFEMDNMNSKIMKDISGKYSIITESFIKEGHKYTTLANGLFPELKVFGNEHVDIRNLDKLDKICCHDTIIDTNKDDLILLKYKLKTMIISDFIRKQSDRVPRNFMFEYSGSHVYLMPLYDFENSFLDHMEYLPNSFELDFYNKEIVDYIRNDNDFQNILEKAMLLEMKKILEEVQSNYPIKIDDDEIKEYEDIINEKQNEIKNYKLLR